MRTVMIVDDEPNVVKGLLDHVPWEELGLTVSATASDGVEALEKIRDRVPDIVFTDVYMPRMDGLSLIQQLTEQYPQIYIVIHSGYDEFDNARIAMRYGVQHFLLKPSTVQEISTVFQEILQEMTVSEKQHKLLEHFEEEQKNYLHYVKDTFIRELLVTRYQPNDLPQEKLELLQLSEETYTVVASLKLIRPPYITKSKEREWQLMKFGSGNIIEEIIAESAKDGLEIHAVDYSDSMFLVIFFAHQEDLQLEAITKHVMQQMVDNILLYMKLSLSVGIGEVKQGLHELMNSYLESQKALEAADYLEMNQVFTYSEVQDPAHQDGYHYPFDILKETYSAIHNQEATRMLDIWQRFEVELLSEHRMPFFITQNICISLIGVLMMDRVAQGDMQQQMTTLSNWFTEIHAQSSRLELCQWMRRWIENWLEEEREEWSGSRSHVLVQELKEYVRNHYDEEITLTEIAEKLYVNRNYLSQLFKRVTGETFVSYLNKYRIEKAKEIMREKHYLVSEISEMVGYQNSTYFSQVFKSITGKSPSEFYK